MWYVYETSLSAHVGGKSSLVVRPPSIVYLLSFSAIYDRIIALLYTYIPNNAPHPPVTLRNTTTTITITGRDSYREKAEEKSDEAMNEGGRSRTGDVQSSSSSEPSSDLVTQDADAQVLRPSTPRSKYCTIPRTQNKTTKLFFIERLAGW